MAARLLYLASQRTRASQEAFVSFHAEEGNRPVYSHKSVVRAVLVPQGDEGNISIKGDTNTAEHFVFTLYHLDSDIEAVARRLLNVRHDAMLTEISHTLTNAFATYKDHRGLFLLIDKIIELMTPSEVFRVASAPNPLAMVSKKASLAWEDRVSFARIESNLVWKAKSSMSDIKQTLPLSPSLLEKKGQWIVTRSGDKGTFVLHEKGKQTTVYFRGGRFCAGNTSTRLFDEWLTFPELLKNMGLDAKGATDIVSK